ncbi:hypothetical protein L596_025979 [Steinernema carpocapsae]|nr:hypothetical protein L596_025979 [Steinernema carpocapsae]
MMHGPCGTSYRHMQCMQKHGDRCDKDFPKPYSEETVLEEDQKPRYRRRESAPHFVNEHGERRDSRWVVGYNPYLTLKYNAHVNVEVCTGIKCVKYLFKYVYKGMDKASLFICETGAVENEQQNPDVLNHDEVQNYADARYVGPAEACWRLLGYPMQETSHNVERLAIHLEGEQNIMFDEEEDPQVTLDRARLARSTLTAWFELNQNDPSARGYLYKDIPKHFVWIKKDKKWSPRQKGKAIGRIYQVSPTQTECFRLRLLLLNVPGATSYEALRTVRGTDERGNEVVTTYSTFSETAKALGLLRDDEEWERCLQDSAFEHMPFQMRALFVLIITQCSPGDVPGLYAKFEREMADDFVHRLGNEELGLEMSYADIERRLQQLGKTVTSFGLPAPLRSYEELMSNAEIVDQAEERRLGNEKYAMLNAEQKAVVDTVLAQLDNAGAENRCHFIDGPGGSGKTFVYNTLIHILRGRGLKFAAMAYTGIAAQLLPEGKTIHHHFRLTVGNSMQANVKATEKRGALLREASVLIVDEVSTVSKNMLDEMDRKMRELTCVNAPFGGKIMLLGGDFRQILPVKRFACRGELVNFCIKSSELWPLFNKHSLINNMRVREDQQAHKDWLLQLGNGQLPHFDGDKIEIPHKFLGAGDLVTEIFADAIANGDYAEVGKRAILSSKNCRVYKLNEDVLKLLPGEVKTYSSYDSVAEDETPNSGISYPTEYLNSVTHSSLPPHKLELKINATVMLLRNLNIHDGLANGTRLRVLNMRPNVLICKILSGDKAGETAFIPRITLHTDDGVLPVKLSRHQFPVRLGFALTINKSQGQSFDMVGIDLHEEIFVHGQLYVAFSRATSEEGIKVSVKPDDAIMPIVLHRNVVYREVL